MDIRKIPIVFIIGHGRSGTTLLQSILNTHPNIAAPPEYEFIMYFYPRFGKIKHLTKADITEFIEALFSFHPHFYSWLMDRESLTEKLISSAVNENYQVLCKILISLTGEGKEEIKILSDKNSINSLFVKKIMKIFPDAKFIHLIRDPRDSVSGYIKRLQPKNPFFLSWRWRRYNSIIEKFKRKFPDIFFTIKYENMVKELDTTLAALASFFNVPFAEFRKDNIVPKGFQESNKNKFLEKMPAGQRSDIFHKMTVLHENLSQPVNTSHIEKWKREMSPYSIAVTEIITKKCAEKYGYNFEAENHSKVKISGYLLVKSRIIFYGWELFTKWRYTNYKYNAKHKAKTIQKAINKMVH